MLERILEPEAMDTEEDASEYDGMDHSVPNTNFVQRLIELGAYGHMLDIGTGPGHIPLLVAERFADAQLVAVDLSSNMLALAERRRAASPHAGRIAFQLADAKRLDFPDGHFDTVFSNTILHHIPDPRPFLCEARRVLRPGGVLLIRDLYRPTDRATLDRLVEAHCGGESPNAKKLFGDSLHAALTPDELRLLANDCGLSDAQLVIDTDRHMSLQRAAS